MTISKDLFLEILSMDSYNRGYGAGIVLPDEEGTMIGSASINVASDQINSMSAEAQAASSYAIAYDVNSDGPTGLENTIVISYRRTDTPCPKAAPAYLSANQRMRPRPRCR